MRVTFYRIADHEWGHVLIECDDHVVYRMNTGPITARIPHDLVHFTVEDTLRVTDGIWGAIAGGVVFGSMTHVSGRRAPHAADRSTELKRIHRDRIQRAELLGGLVEAAADRPDAELPKLTKAWFPTDPPELAALADAVRALRRAEERWAALAIGAKLTLDWPAHRRAAPPVARRPADHRRGRTGSSRSA